MPRSLDFDYQGNAVSFEIEKVDRTKLYGEVDLETFDAEGRPCKLATLARDGRTVIPYGGTASGYLNQDGNWIDRDNLVPVDPKGTKLEEVPSTFDHISPLDNEVPVEEYLDHAIRLSYLLTPEGELDPALKKALSDGKIFRFPFSYRGGTYADPAFLLAGENDSLWMMIGQKGEVDFVGFEQAAICVAHEDEETEDDTDDGFDFDML